MAISQFVDTTGTILNRYTVTYSDSTTEDVLLTFKPSDDYIAGTGFNAANMNQIINAINGTEYTNISVSVTPVAGTYQAWDTANLYGYYADVPVLDITTNTFVESIILTDTIQNNVAYVYETKADAIRFYTKDATTLSGTILYLITRER